MECAKVSYPKNYILYILCSAHVYLIIVRHVCKTFVFLKYTAVTTMPNYANGITLIKLQQRYYYMILLKLDPVNVCNRFFVVKNSL